MSGDANADREEMSQFYSEEPFELPGPRPLAPGEVRGNGWSAMPKDGKYVLDFISGALFGRGISINITAEEYLGLKDGRITFNEVVIRYGTG
jgi:hypothetical protein